MVGDQLPLHGGGDFLGERAGGVHIAHLDQHDQRLGPMVAGFAEQDGDPPGEDGRVCETESVFDAGHRGAFCGGVRGWHVSAANQPPEAPDAAVLCRRDYVKTH